MAAVIVKRASWMVLSTFSTNASKIHGHNAKMKRLMTTASSTGVIFRKYGDPQNVLELENVDLPELLGNSVKVQMLASPINPADINQIQGTYPVKPVLPAIGGNEGVGKVLEVGGLVTSVKPGDWVVPMEMGKGCWQSHWVLSEDELSKISSDVPLSMAATLSVNPPTAYRMLKDFVHLQPGDTVIQNGANSGVGQAVIQIAAAWGINTVNIIRDRPDLSELTSHLEGLGASHVITEDFSSGSEMKEFWKNVSKPKLAFNCVGGKSSTELQRHLNHGGVMVTYGGMSRKPITVPTSVLIFKDVSLRGFWMSRWKDEHKGNDHERVSMMEELSKMALKGELKAPSCDMHLLKDYKTAIEKATSSYTSKKQLFVTETQP